MKLIFFQIVILFLLGGLSGCAGTGEPQDDVADADSPRGGDCIYQPTIRGYRVLDEQNLIVDAGRTDYHIALVFRAHGLNDAWGIVFDTPGGRVCEGFSTIHFRGPFGERETARIQSLRQITPEEKEHLLIRFGKKKPEVEQTPPPQEVEGADVEELDASSDE